jgi:hypothetical protein
MKIELIYRTKQWLFSSSQSVRFPEGTPKLSNISVGQAMTKNVPQPSVVLGIIFFIYWSTLPVWHITWFLDTKPKPYQNNICSCGDCKRGKLGVHYWVYHNTLVSRPQCIFPVLLYLLLSEGLYQSIRTLKYHENKLLEMSDLALCPSKAHLWKASGHHLACAEPRSRGADYSHSFFSMGKRTDLRGQGL